MDQNTNNIQQEIPEVPADWAYPKPVQPTITFNNETTIKGYAIKSSMGDELLIFPEDPMTIMEVASIFSNPEYTSRIESETSYTGHVVFEGYTNLTSVETSSDGKLIIRLRKSIT